MLILSGLSNFSYCVFLADGVVGKRFFALTVSGAVNIESPSLSPIPPLTNEPLEFVTV